MPRHEEVVIATESGALMWMHVNDIAALGDVLGSDYYQHVGAAPQNQTQPHTNANLSAAWAIAQRFDDDLLHVLDQRGGYWRIGWNAAGGEWETGLWQRELSAVGARGWEDLGNRDLTTGAMIPLAATLWDPNRLSIQQLLQPPISFATWIRSRPWCPINPNPLELQNTSFYARDNWARSPLSTVWFDGFLIHGWGGSMVDSASGPELWKWSARDGDFDIGWGNMLEGVRFQPGTSVWDISGLWASTQHDGSSAQTADRLEYLDTRSSITFQTPMTQQAIRAHTVNDNPVLVLGCPGGRVRIARPGQMATPPNGAHVLDPDHVASADLGYGGAALATKQMPTGEIKIWFGTSYGPTPRPGQYSSSGGVLSFGEVATGEVHRMFLTPGGILSTLQTTRLSPGSTTRGGYAVTGLAVADLLPEQQGSPVDELIVCTLAGDVIVLNADTLAEIWRAHVPGAVGAYNSIVVADMDDDSHKELYVCGSLGVWRFTQP